VGFFLTLSFVIRLVGPFPEIEPGAVAADKTLLGVESPQDVEAPEKSSDLLFGRGLHQDSIDRDFGKMPRGIDARRPATCR
jgi:hypothetical protein